MLREPLGAREPACASRPVMHRTWDEIEWIRAEKGGDKAYNKRCRAMQCCVATSIPVPALPVSLHFEGVGDSPIRAFRSDGQQAPSGAS
jgi:hypothetical protein